MQVMTKAEVYCDSTDLSLVTQPQVMLLPINTQSRVSMYLIRSLPSVAVQ